MASPPLTPRSVFQALRVDPSLLRASRFLVPARELLRALARAAGRPDPAALTPGSDPELAFLLLSLVTLAGIALAAIVFVAATAALAAFRIARPRRRPRDTILLLGAPSDADRPGPGKTALYMALKHNRQPKYGLVPSIHPNESLLRLPQLPRPLPLVDFPGHPRAAHELPSYLRRARIVAYVLDAASFPANLSAHAAQLAFALAYVLEGRRGARRAAPVAVVFVNKTDIMPLGRTLDEIKSALGAEIDRFVRSVLAQARKGPVAAATIAGVDPTRDRDHDPAAREISDEQRAQLWEEACEDRGIPVDNAHNAQQLFSWDAFRDVVTLTHGSALHNQVGGLIDAVVQRFGV